MERDRPADHATVDHSQATAQLDQQVRNSEKNVFSKNLARNVESEKIMALEIFNVNVKFPKF